MSPSSAKYVGSIDQGTSSTRFILFEIATGKSVYSHQVEFTQINYDDAKRSGWAEHDPMEIMKTVHTCIDEVLKKAKITSNEQARQQIAAIGITNQRETTVVWNKQTGKPLHNALVWHDTRTADLVNNLIDTLGKGDKDFLRNACGLPCSTYFSAMKLLWLTENVPAVKQAIQQQNAQFGTIDSWLIYNLTGNHVTDISNASRTMLMDIETRQWSKSTCDLLGVDMSILPTIKSNAERFGEINSGLAKGIQIAGCLGDQQAAMVGQLCFDKGSAKNTYGTGCFMLLNTGTKAVHSEHGLLTTIAFQFGDKEECYYALEGAIPVAGSAVQWLRDKVKIIKEAPEVNDLAKEVKDNGGCYFVTAFSGLLSPYWRNDARGVIAGLSHSTTRGHIARATLEAVCWQTRDVADAMAYDSGVRVQELKVDGGMANSDIVAQFQADVLQVPVVRPENLEATAAGAAYAAGLSVGAWSSLDALIKIVKPAQRPTTFKPQVEPEVIAHQFHMWHRAVNSTFGWAERVPGMDHLPANRRGSVADRKQSLEDEAMRGLKLAKEGGKKVAAEIEGKESTAQLIVAVGSFILGVGITWFGLRGGNGPRRYR